MSGDKVGKVNDSAKTLFFWSANKISTATAGVVNVYIFKENYHKQPLEKHSPYFYLWPILNIVSMLKVSDQIIFPFRPQHHTFTINPTKHILFICDDNTPRVDNKSLHYKKFK